MALSVFITGASGDIGESVAEVFAKNGYNICLCGHSEAKAPKLRKKANELEQKYNIRSIAFSLDVTSSKACSEAVKFAVEQFGSLDVLVNNAGVIDYSLLMRTSEEDYNSIISCNQSGVFFMMQEAGKIMKKQKRGSIVNVSSVAGIKGCAGSAAYAASKGAVNVFTKTAAVEFAPYNIRVNAVAPGMIEGGMSNLLSIEQKNRSAQTVAMKRFGNPQEVAEAVYFLASPSASYITGAILRVDGGMLE